MNSRRRGEANLLVSFCNVKDREKQVLAAVRVDDDRHEVEWIDIKSSAFVQGATGLCFWNGLVCVAHQGGPETDPGFVLLNPDLDFEQVGEGLLPSASGIHSVCCVDQELYFVAARKDSVFKATLDSRSGEWRWSQYWTFPDSSGHADENHLNAIDHVNGDLCVSGFGEKKGDQWTSATRGFIYNIDHGEYVVRDVYHPHSLLEDSRIVWTSESARNRLLSSNGDELVFPAGYIRGLAISEDFFYVGSSKRRTLSESTGAVNRQSLGRFEGTCCIYRLAKGTEEPQVLVDFSEIRNEIYEMILV